jgi:hypothetical protein
MSFFKVFAWVAVFVLPLNAAVNPVLYTISTAPFLGPAQRGLRTFKRSWKLSLTMDQRRTYSSTLGKINAGPPHALRCGPLAVTCTGWEEWSVLLSVRYFKLKLVFHIACGNYRNPDDCMQLYNVRCSSHKVL